MSPPDIETYQKNKLPPVGRQVMIATAGPRPRPLAIAHRIYRFSRIYEASRPFRTHHSVLATGDSHVRVMSTQNRETSLSKY